MSPPSFRVEGFFATDHGQITTDITEKGVIMETKESVSKALKKDG